MNRNKQPYYYFKNSKAKGRPPTSNNYKCPNCQNSYNKTERIPIKLKNCDHTICKYCLKQRMINHNTTCPIDGYLIYFNYTRKDQEFSGGKTELENFCEDESVLKSMNLDVSTEVTNSFRESFKDSIHRFKIWEKREKASSLNNMQKLQHAKKNNRCIIHNKSLEILCVNPECMKKICTNCALFGDHRGHQIKSEFEIINYAETKTKELVDVQKGLKDSESLFQKEKWDTLLNNTIKINEIKVIQDIDNFYDVRYYVK